MQIRPVGGTAVCCQFTETLHVQRKQKTPSTLTFTGNLVFFSCLMCLSEECGRSPSTWTETRQRACDFHTQTTRQSVTLDALSLQFPKIKARLLNLSFAGVSIELCELIEKWRATEQLLSLTHNRKRGTLSKSEQAVESCELPERVKG